jgi:Kef-type K+ transport system membrane component KefB
VTRRAAALVLILLTVVVLRQADSGADDPRTGALALGFALIAATLLGEVAERLHLPRLSGYLAFGLLCGPYMLNLVTSTMARELQAVNGLAIALIALIAGLEINIQRLRSRIWAIATVGMLTIAIMYVTLSAFFILIAWPWLPILPDATGLERLAVGLVFTAIVVSFSPTVTIAVIAESRARGPLSELVMAIVVIADLALILAFTLAMQLARTITTGGSEGIDISVRLAWEIGGSLAFGALLGGLFAMYLRTLGRELTLVLLALCAAISAAGRIFHLEPLLAAVAAGLVIENVAPARADALRDAVERSALPVLVIFFAAAGASLHVDALAVIGVAAAAISLVRLAAIRASTAISLRAAGIQDSVSGMMWMGLVSQAGVTLGLTILVAAEFPDWGPAVQTLVVAMIALHEVAGPILFKAALTRAGEVGALDRQPSQSESVTLASGT